MADIDDIVRGALEGNAIGVQDMVNQMMQQRVADVVDVYRQALAQEYYGIPEDEQDQVEEPDNEEQEIEDQPEDYSDDQQEFEDNDDMVDLDTDLEDLLQGLEDQIDDEQEPE